MMARMMMVLMRMKEDSERVDWLVQLYKSEQKSNVGMFRLKGSRVLDAPRVSMWGSSYGAGSIRAASDLEHCATMHWAL